jgi:pimeloyl-ACP methyl ester carboxylesterase
MTDIEAKIQPAAPHAQAGTVVLVHGAWADGSSWARVVTPLQRQGFEVRCAPLPLTSFDDDIAALRRVVERTTGPVLLVAHAYAGAVIAAVRHERVKGLVFIAALAPDEGETVAEVFYREQAHPAAPALARDEDGLIWMPDEGFGQAFAQHADAETQRLLCAVQRPIALPCIQTPAPVPAWKSTPSWYLVAEQDRMISPKTQRFMAHRMGAHITEYAVDHTPLVTAPELVLETINAAWASLAPRHSN